MFLTNRRVIIAAVSSVFAMIFMLFYDTIYSDDLLANGVKQDYIGKK